MKSNYFKVSLPLVILVNLLVFSSCWNTHDKSEETKKEIDNKEKLIAINKYLVRKDVEQIENTIKRNKWNMQKTQTGLFYEFLQKTQTERVKTGQKITLAYKTFLLDNTLCYSSDSTGVKQFVAGGGGVESGLEEAVLLLGVGDKARFILPPHLAHGLLGDGNRIPPRSSIIYELEMLKTE